MEEERTRKKSRKEKNRKQKGNKGIRNKGGYGSKKRKEQVRK